MSGNNEMLDMKIIENIMIVDIIQPDVVGEWGLIPLVLMTCYFQSKVL